MAKKKIDGVIEAVHFEQEGKIKWVRAYLRRGFTYSDVMIIDRNALIDYLKSGLKIYAGKRVPRLGSTFELGEPLHLVQVDGTEVLNLGKTQTNKDSFPTVPRI